MYSYFHSHTQKEHQYLEEIDKHVETINDLRDQIVKLEMRLEESFIGKEEAENRLEKANYQLRVCSSKGGRSESWLNKNI